MKSNRSNSIPLPAGAAVFPQRQLGLCWGLVSSPGAQEAAGEMDSSVFVIQANRVLKVRLESEKCIGFLSA